MRRFTPTLIVCLAGTLTAGLALARPASSPTPAPVSSPTTAAISAPQALVPVETRIDIIDFTFGPVTAAPGQTVTVANSDGAKHTATSPDRLFDTGPIQSGTAVSFVAPSEPGSYPYFCAIHPSMIGDVIVAD